MVHALNKGKAGEREACKWLFDNLAVFKGEDAEEPKRILDQAREGGADIVIEDLIIEVKRRETLNLADWWYQVAIARKRHPDKEYLVPVVMFRQNRKQWEFLLPANLIGVEKGFVRVTKEVFIEFADNLHKGIGKNHAL